MKIENINFLIHSSIESDNSSNEDDELLFKNPNRKQFVHIEESDTDSSEDEVGSEEENEEYVPEEESLHQKEINDGHQTSNLESLESLTENIKKVTFNS